MIAGIQYNAKLQRMVRAIKRDIDAQLVPLVRSLAPEYVTDAAPVPTTDGWGDIIAQAIRSLLAKWTDPRAQAVALKNGVDISALRGRQVKPAGFRRFTHLVAMDHDNLANLRRLAPPDAIAELSLLLDHVEGRAGQAVADPYFGEDDGFDVTWAEVTAGARALAAELQRRRG